MTSQTLIHSSSLAPKLATFNSRSNSADEHATLVSVDENRTHMPGGWNRIPDVEHNEYVQKLGEFAVDEANKKRPHAEKITFMRVVAAEQQVVAGMNYRLWIEGKVKKMERLFKALVFVGLPDRPKKLESFEPVEWVKSK